MYETFIDLDELIVQCRDKVSRKFIQEAVSCYRAGAFRSCIVSTWNAVVFDFLYKLRELELFGDREAGKLLEEFDTLRSSGKKFKELWQFESNIPELAQTKFELISTVEKSDIARLFEDRSRCAHPSMTSLEEPFEATAELARYHLRSAVTNLLSRPPVQGRAAKDSIFRDIRSEYFPKNLEDVIVHFKKGPLVRARRILIKDIIVGITTSLLTENYLEDERVRQFLALNAVSNIYPRETREILNENLSKIIIHKVLDENLDKVIIFLGSIDTWDSLDEACMLKATIFIDKIDIFEKPQPNTRNKKISQESMSVLTRASHIVFLRESIARKLQVQVPLKELILLQKRIEDSFFKEQILFPILLNSSPQATLGELIKMISEPSLKSNNSIQNCIRKKIEALHLKELVSILSSCHDDWLIDLIKFTLNNKIITVDLHELTVAKPKYASTSEDQIENEILELFNKYITQRYREEVDNISLGELLELVRRSKDMFFVNLIEPDMKSRVPDSSFKDLLKAKWVYSQIVGLDSEMIELFDDLISTQVAIISLDDLIIQYRYWDQISSELIKPILKKNIPELVEKLIRSDSYDAAEIHSEPIIRIAEYLSQEQWKNILEAFFKNNQMYESYGCRKKFELLFKRSLEIDRSLERHTSVQAHWRIFREKLIIHNINGFYTLRRLI